MTTPGQFTLASQHLGCLPIVNFFLAHIGLADHLATYLPHDDIRLRLAPAAVIEVVVRNLVAGHRPVYALGEWAAPYDPAVLGLQAGEAELLNDDRVGRTLDGHRRRPGEPDHLHGAGGDLRLRRRDRPAAQRLDDHHRDRGLPDADGRDRGGKATPAIVYGHNKDFRPDLKQLLLILTISADGAVPIAYRVADGSTPDDVTHIPTWEQLRALWAGRASSTSRTASSARNRPWVTSPATVGGSSPSCRNERTTGSGTGHRPTPPPGRRIMSEKRREFDQKFRDGAVRIVRESGKPIARGGGPWWAVVGRTQRPANQQERHTRRPTRG